MKKNILSWGIRVLVTVGLFVWIFTKVVQPHEIKEELAGISIAWLLAAALMQALAMYSSIWRWNVLLRGQGLNVSHWHLVSTFLIGRFFGTFLPSTIGLDAYKTYDIARRANATTQSLAVLIVEKIIGFFALSLLVLLTIPAGLHFFPVEMLIFISLVFCVPVTISFLLLLKPGLVLRLLDLPFPFKQKIEGKLRQAAEAVTAYQHQQGLLLLAVLFGVMVHFFTTLMYFCTASSIDAPVTLSNMLFAGPLMIAATVGIPAIGGEGVREFSLVGLLRLIGVPESSAAVLGFLGFLVGLSISLIGWVIFMTRPASYRAEIRSLKKEDLLPAAAADSPLALSLAENRD